VKPDELAGIMGVFCVFIGVGLAVWLIIAIFFVLTLQKALSRVSPRNRLMEPGMVWLLLVPCVNIVWQFLVAIRVPDSLRNEFRDRRQDDGSDYGKGIALTGIIVGLIGGVVAQVMRGAPPETALAVSAVAGIASIIQLVMFIMFWVKVANYSSRLGADAGPPGWQRKLDDFDDDDGRGMPHDPAPPPPPDTYKEQDPGRYQ
jgi:hypothetical protein